MITLAVPRKNYEFKNMCSDSLKFILRRPVIYNLLSAENHIFPFKIHIFPFIFSSQALCRCGRPRNSSSTSYATIWTFPVCSAAWLQERGRVSPLETRWQAERVLWLREQSSCKRGYDIEGSVMILHPSVILFKFDTLRQLIRLQCMLILSPSFNLGDLNYRGLWNL